jgi:PAS domain-containing protein
MDFRRKRYQPYRTLLKPREAMTIAVHYQVSPSVVDTKIVAATRRAAQFFGYTDPAELEGRFTSMVHLLEDIQRTRLRSTLRALGLVAPTDHYEIRLLQPSGRMQRVIKYVEQREMHNTIVWVCYHEPANDRRCVTSVFRLGVRSRSGSYAAATAIAVDKYP